MAAIVHLGDGMMRMPRPRLGWFSFSLPRPLQHLGVPAVGEGSQPQAGDMDCALLVLVPVAQLTSCRLEGFPPSTGGHP